MKVTVDQNSCIGCGACAAACPGVFELTDDGYAVAKVDAVPEDEADSCKDAADGCPVSAIQCE